MPNGPAGDKGRAMFVPDGEPSIAHLADGLESKDRFEFGIACRSALPSLSGRAKVSGCPRRPRQFGIAQILRHAGQMLSRRKMNGAGFDRPTAAETS